MIAGELRSRVDKLWEMFWTGGITNPLDVIEQITYLIFIRELDIIDDEKSHDAQFFGKCSRLLKISMQIKKVHILNTWQMPFLKYRPRSC